MNNYTENIFMNTFLGTDDEGQPCGVHYYIKIFVGENETDRTHKRGTVTMGIRKVQYAPSKQGRQPCTVVRKDFMMSPGELELEVTLDKQVTKSLTELKHIFPVLFVF